MKWRTVDKAVAYHEASHAVIAVNDGALVKYVEVTSGYDCVAGDIVCTGGNCQHYSYKGGADRAIQTVDIALAGFIGERLYMKPDRRRVCSGSLLSNDEWLERCEADYMLVLNNADKCVRGGNPVGLPEEIIRRKVTQYVRGAANDLAKELRQWWPSVTALAEELIARCGPTGCRLLTNEVHEVLIGANNGIGRDYINRLNGWYARFLEVAAVV
jgi:hypothetical protein